MPVSRDVKRDCLLVIHPGALGDVLLALPAIRGIRARYPGHRLALVAGSAVGHLLKECGEIDYLFSMEGPAMGALTSGDIDCVPALAAWMRRCQALVSWAADSGNGVELSCKGCGVADIIISSPHSSRLRCRHQSDRFLEATMLNTSPQADGILRLPDALRARGREALRAMGFREENPFVFVHPGSGSRHKCVPPRTLIALCEWLQGAGVSVGLIRGPADQPMFDALAAESSCLPPRCSDSDLLTVASMLSRGALFVGHDSGLTHLASALGVRTIALFGPTDPHRWAPRGNGVTILQGASCRCGDWGQVQHCVEKPCLDIPASKLTKVCRAALSDAEERTLSCTAGGVVLESPADF